MAKADAKIELNKHLQTLRAKEEAAQQKLKELKDAGVEAWERAKPDLEKGYSSTYPKVSNLGERSARLPC